MVVLISLGTFLHAQECDIYGFNKTPSISPGVEYSASYGLCYHYNSTTIESGYKRHHASVTFMNRNKLRATSRMQDEIYLGYTYRHEIARKIHLGGSTYLRIGQVEPVGRLFVDYKIYGPVHVHGSIIQVSSRMTHLIGGIKIVI